SRIRTGASDRPSAWVSVLIATNSTPRTPDWIMRLTALLPPPPMPRTTMRAAPSRVVCPFIDCTLPPPSISINRLYGTDASPLASWQEVAQPIRDGAADVRERHPAARARGLEFLLESPLQQANTGRVRRRRDLVGQAIDACGRSNAYR